MIENRTAIVTGGGVGIGRAIALALAHRGANVVVTSRTRQALRDTSEEIRKIGGRSLPVVSDVSNEAEVASVVALAIREFGSVDILVNNAGIAGPTAPVVKTELADWNQTLTVNLTGAFLFSKAVLPGMIGRKSGKIVNISSIAGKMAYALRTPYAASKWGMIGFTRSLAQEVGPHNIQVNAVCPGPVEGQRMRDVISARALELGRPEEEVERLYTDATALKRMVSESDIASMVLFLVSGEAENITGQAIEVTAGYAL
jgi:NAD(P)-dependent dehydrogenase (short-subunit alcohol dehydrogenase family)